MNELMPLPAHLTREMEAQTPKPKNALGRDDFMKLLLTQLKNQDPLKPMANQEFVAQLAQFGALEQLSNIDKGVSGLKDGMGRESRYQALNLIGKQVVASGDELNLTQGESVKIPNALSSDIRPLRATISEPNGKIVREIDLSQRPSGEVSEIQWDGKDNEGKSLPSGKYTFRVMGADASGKTQTGGAQISGRVVGVNLNSDVPKIQVATDSGTQEIELTKLNSVTDSTPSPAKLTLSNPAANKAEKPVVVQEESVAAEPAENADSEGFESSDRWALNGSVHGNR